MATQEHNFLPLYHMFDNPIKRHLFSMPFQLTKDHLFWTGLCMCKIHIYPHAVRETETLRGTLNTFPINQRSFDLDILCTCNFHICISSHCKRETKKDMHTMTDRQSLTSSAAAPTRQVSTCQLTWPPALMIRSLSSMQLAV